jgi:peroxiredoxin
MQGLRGVGLVAAVVAAGAVLILLLSDATPPPIAPGQAAPAFELERLDGGRVSLESLRGRVVLLNFWATWCPPCEEEMPAMERLHQTLAGQPFELVAVSVDEDRNAVVKFRERLGLHFPILLDPRRKVSGAYQTFRYPESFLIDPQGRIVSHFIGNREWDAASYVAQIRALLPPATTAGTPAR